MIWLKKIVLFVAVAPLKAPNTIDTTNSKLHFWKLLDIFANLTQEISEFKQVRPHLTQSSKTCIKVLGAKMIKPWTKQVYGCMDVWIEPIRLFGAKVLNAYFETEF